MDAEQLALELERIRPDLYGYLERLLVDNASSEDALQSTAIRALGSLAAAPTVVGELRPWLFRIATNLALDELRRRGRWKQDVLIDSRTKAEGDPAFVEGSAKLQGSPEMKVIAKEHLAACFVCTMQTLSPERSAALLLREVYGFSTEEIARMIDARAAQVKNWLQEARRTMESYYEQRCALIRKDGVCYQCAELSEFFNGVAENPLSGAHGTFDERLRILRSLNDRPLNGWHRKLFSLFDEL